MSRILVVEDHPMNRLLLRDILEHRGHDVIEARDVGEARRVLAEGTPDLVLLDIQIPGGGGESVLSSIRTTERTSRLPVIAVTASAMVEDRQRLLTTGFDGYISKPIDTRAFGPAVEEFLRRETV